MAQGFNIRAWLGLDTKAFTKGLRGARNSMGTFRKSLRGVNDVLRGLQFAAVGVTAVGAFSRAVSTIKDFETNMARVKVISQATEEEMSKMTSTAREIGATTRFSASEAASGLQFLSMAGLNAQESLQTLPSTLNLAGAGMISVGRSADIVTNVLSGFNLAASEAAIVSDVFAQASRESNQTVEELYEGVKLIAPAYNNLGLSVKEASRDMALLANSGIKAEQAGTALAGALSRLLRQPPLVAKALAELGVEVTENKIKQEGLIGVIQELRNAGISATQMTKILGLHWKTTGALISKTDEEIQDITDRMDGFNGAAKDMSEDGIGAIDKSLKLLNSAVDELFISLGYDGLSGAIVTLVDNIRNLTIWFTNLSKSSKIFQVALIALIFKGNSLIRLIKGVGGAVKIASIAFKRGAVAARLFGATMKASLGPIGWVALALEGVILVMDNYESKTEKLKKAQEESLKKTRELKDEIGTRSKGDLEKDLVILNKQLKDYQNEVAHLIQWNPESEKLSEYNRELQDTREFISIISGEIAKRNKAEKETEESVKKRKKAEDEAQAASKAMEEAVLKAKIERLKTIELTELKTLDNIKDAVDVLEEARNKASGDEIKSLETRIQALNVYKKALLDIRSIEDAPEKIEGVDIGATTPSVTANLGINIDPKQLQNMDQVNEGLQKTLNLANSLSDLSPLATLNQEFEQMIEHGNVFESAMGRAGQSLTELASEGADSMEELGAAVGNVIRTTISGLIAQGVAGAMASMMGTGPWGLILAPIAAATATTLFNSLVPAFEHGGVVPGTSFSGDKMMARVNSGEMVLNNRQQSNLFSMIDRGGINSGGQMGEVRFKIENRDLVGWMNNTSKYNKTNG